MASTAGGSGAGGGDRCPSGEKGTTRVGRRSKKPSAFHRAALRYLEKEYRECMARGEEPPFDLEDLLRRYGSSPPNSEVSAPPSYSAPATFGDTYLQKKGILSPRLHRPNYL